MSKNEDPIVQLDDLIMRLQEEFDRWLENKIDNKKFAVSMQDYLAAMSEITDKNILYRKVQDKKE